MFSIRVFLARFIKGHNDENPGVYMVEGMDNCNSSFLSVDDEEINKIMEGLDCPNGFKCIEHNGHGKNGLCNAKNIGIGDFLECDVKTCPETYCKFRLPFGYSHFCRCPLHVYLAKQE